MLVGTTTLIHRKGTNERVRMRDRKMDIWQLSTIISYVVFGANDQGNVESKPSIARFMFWFCAGGGGKLLGTYCTCDHFDPQGCWWGT